MAPAFASLSAAGCNLLAASESDVVYVAGPAAIAYAALTSVLA